MTEAFVFDMDGLLLDSERIVKRSWEEAGNQLGIAHMGEHIYHTLGMNRAGRNAYFKQTLGESFPEEEFSGKASAAFYRIVAREGLSLKSGAKEILKYAKERGYKLAVATSSRREYASGVLKDAGIYDYFDGAVFGDMVKRTKPDPEIYIKACAGIHADPRRCIAFEDAPAGIRSAYSAGLKVIAVPDLTEPDPGTLALAWKRVDTLCDAVRFLEGNLA